MSVIIGNGNNDTCQYILENMYDPYEAIPQLTKNMSKVEPNIYSIFLFKQIILEFEKEKEKIGHPYQD